jgi:DMSO/TMAO reductase YedYZ molybdopterin-dependent catalytic subunit
MADENDPPPTSKLTRSKERWAREGRFLTGKTSRPEEQRLPPGQHLTRDWPVLDLGLTPKISRERWRLDIYGAVENPIFWDFAQFAAQPQTQFTSDIHCVTTSAAHRISRARCAGLLGSPRLSQPRRSVAGAALFRRLSFFVTSP